MVDKKIDITSLVFFLSKGSFLGIAVYNIFLISKETSIVTAIIGFIIGLIPVFLIAYMMNKNENKNIFEIVEKYFGKWMGSITNIGLLVFAIFFAVTILYNLISFADLNYMPETEKIYIGILLIAPIIIALNKGIYSVAKASKILWYISLAIVGISLAGLVGSYHIENIFPLFNIGMKNGIISSLYYSVFTSIPIIFITCIEKSKIRDHKKYTKNMVKYYIISNIVSIALILVILLILGFPLISIYKYPEYMMLKKVGFFQIIERIENILALHFIFEQIILLFMSIYFAYRALIHYLARIKKDGKIAQNIVSYVLCIAILLTSLFVYKNITVAIEFNTSALPLIMASSILPLLANLCFFSWRQSKKDREKFRQ